MTTEPTRSRGRIPAPGPSSAPLAVVRCSDCHPTPEVILDRSSSSFITIQTPGLLTTEGVVASVEAAVGLDGARVVIVLAHDDCPILSELATRGHLTLHSGLRGVIREARGVGALPDRPFGNSGGAIARIAHANALAQARAILARSQVVQDAVTGGRVALRVVLFSSASGTVSTYPLP
jgi:carbonic anhydrase